MTEATAIELRPMREGDLADLAEIFDEIIADGTTYALDAGMSREELGRFWSGRGGEQWVAHDGARVLGGYTVRANHPGRGAHVATAAYAVARAARGLGVGRRLGEHSLERARALGFAAMQFNLVISTNEPAVHLWQALGFAIVGTLPQVFQHPRRGLVDAYVMHRFLGAPAARG